MNTSNTDILAFLKASQSDHAKEREQDKLTRAQERKEDMEHILAVIQKGVQKEVRAAVKSIEERLMIQEKVNQELTKKFVSVKNELELLKVQFNNLQRGPNQVQEQEVQGVGYGGRQVDVGEAELSRLDMCASARRIIGFTPIEPRMLDMQVQSYGARNMEEAKLMEIKSYLKCEMRMSQSEIKKLDIIKVFLLAKQEWNVLYVELGSDSQVDMVMSHTRYMVKKDHRVVRWYPKQMYERYRAVEAIAYNMRKNQNLKTRVKVGSRDIELSTREEGCSYWRKQVLPDSLPGFDMQETRSPLTSSPPPGRPSRAQGFIQQEKDKEIVNEVVSDGIVVEANTDKN